MSVDGRFYGMPENVPPEIEAALATILGTYEQVASAYQGLRPLTELEVLRVAGQAVSRGASLDEVETYVRVFLGKVVCPGCSMFPMCSGGQDYVRASEGQVDGDEDFIDLLIRVGVLPNGDDGCPLNQMAKERLSSTSGKLRLAVARFGQTATDFGEDLADFRRGLNDDVPIDNHCSCPYCKGMRTRLRLDVHAVTRWPLERLLAFWNVVWPPKAEDNPSPEEMPLPVTDVVLIIG